MKKCPWESGCANTRSNKKIQFSIIAKLCHESVIA